MTIFMDRVAESERWTGTVEPGIDALPDRIPGENATTTTETPARSRRDAILASIVQAEILPRLERRRQSAAPAATVISALTTENDDQTLVHLLLTQDASAAVAFIDGLRGSGATPASLYLGILTNAARCLGELWEQDRCGFDQVTIGMGHLQIVLRSLSPHFQREAIARAQTESVLLVPAPGEQHTFGLLMLAEFFRREGWHVAGGPMTSPGDAVIGVRNTWIDVAAFSIGSASLIDGLAACIKRVRCGSCNPALCVIVGGPLFHARPDLLASNLLANVGADLLMNDATGAVRQARELLAIRAAAAD